MLYSIVGEIISPFHSSQIFQRLEYITLYYKATKWKHNALFLVVTGQLMMGNPFQQCLGVP